MKCCGTTHLTYGPMRREPRGMPPRWRTSRKVFHKKGLSRLWHWEDQTHNLAEGYANADHEPVDP